jgi:hypothetical protein
MTSNSTTPNPFADEPQRAGRVRLQSAADPLDPYAAPAGEAEYFESLGPGVGLWRQEHEIVMHRHAAFPPRCVLTNAPNEELVPRRLAWGHPFDIGLTQQLMVPYAISPRAAQGLSWFRMLAICIAIAAVAGLVFLWYAFSQNLVPYLIVPMGFLMLVFAGCFKIALDAKRPLKIVARGGEYLWIIGAGPEFLSSLPRWPHKKKNELP